MSNVTRATVALGKAGVAFELLRYAYDAGAERIGLAAAEALGAPPARVLKTLMVLADGRPACAILPCDREVAMKRLAVALGAKHAEMMPPAMAERVSGYKVGGISPFGQTRALPVAIEAAALDHDWVLVNGGQRGLQLRLDPRAAARAAGAIAGAIVA